MMKFVMPVILIGISVSVFFMFTNPIYNEVGVLKTEMSSYDEALDNAVMLEEERERLTSKYSTINPDDLVKLQKLLPDNIDNIRLILEIGKIASPYAMILTDVKYNANEKAETTPAVSENQGGAAARPIVKNYGVFDLEFSTTASYNNFLSFLKDLESNLRIVDISSIEFSSDVSTGTGSKATSSEVYKYSFKIRTYWLKN